MELNVELNKNVEKNNFLNSVLGRIVNVLRSFPFIILMIILIP